MTTLSENFDRFGWDAVPKYWFHSDNRKTIFYRWNLWWTNAVNDKFWLGCLVMTRDATSELWGCQTMHVPDDDLKFITRWWERSYPSNEILTNRIELSWDSPWNRRVHKKLSAFKPLQEQLEGVANFMLLQIPRDAEVDWDALELAKK